jgi:putative glutamine amidotransferase
MKTAPLILIAPATEEKGYEFYDYSISLSEPYLDAILSAGGLPVVMPCAPSEKIIAEYVRRADGVLLTGGDDVRPELYTDKLPEKLRKTVGHTDPKRDLQETLLIKETFAQRKPLLAICRGHQILNAALGGTLTVDIASQVKTPINHSRLEHKDQLVHQVKLEGGSLLSQIFGRIEVEVNSSHHQAVDKLAGPLRATGKSPDGVIEACELKREDEGLLPYLLSVQFHPERLVRAHPEFLELFRSFTAACALNRENSYEAKDFCRGR